MAFNMNDFFPCPSKALLRGAFVGKHLRDVPAPAAILDRAIVKDNCDRMLKACQSLGVAFRPHVKTHKVLLRAIQQAFRCFLISISIFQRKSDLSYQASIFHSPPCLTDVLNLRRPRLLNYKWAKILTRLTLLSQPSLKLKI
jgi:hypothetical protein